MKTSWLTVAGAFLLSVAVFCVCVWAVAEFYRAMRWRGGQGLSVVKAEAVAIVSFVAGTILSRMGDTAEKVALAEQEERAKKRAREEQEWREAHASRCPHCSRFY